MIVYALFIIALLTSLLAPAGQTSRDASYIISTLLLIAGLMLYELRDIRKELERGRRLP